MGFELLPGAVSLVTHREPRQGVAVGLCFLVWGWTWTQPTVSLRSREVLQKYRIQPLGDTSQHPPLQETSRSHLHHGQMMHLSGFFSTPTAFRGASQPQRCELPPLRIRLISPKCCCLKPALPCSQMDPESVPVAVSGRWILS